MRDVDVACLGGCGTTARPFWPFCAPCFDRMPSHLRDGFRVAYGAQNAGMLLYAVTDAWAWHVANPRRGDTPTDARPEVAS